MSWFSDSAPEVLIEALTQEGFILGEDFMVVTPTLPLRHGLPGVQLHGTQNNNYLVVAPGREDVLNKAVDLLVDKSIPGFIPAYYPNPTGASLDVEDETKLVFDIPLVLQMLGKASRFDGALLLAAYWADSEGKYHGQLKTLMKSEKMYNGLPVWVFSVWSVKSWDDMKRFFKVLVSQIENKKGQVEQSLEAPHEAAFWLESFLTTDDFYTAPGTTEDRMKEVFAYIVATIMSQPQEEIQCALGPLYKTESTREVLLKYCPSIAHLDAELDKRYQERVIEPAIALKNRKIDWSIFKN